MGSSVGRASRFLIGRALGSSRLKIGIYKRSFPARSQNIRFHIVVKPFLLFSTTLINCEMAYCYILFSEKIDKFYIGACTNLDRRLYEHNIGHSTFTKSGIPWKIVFSEEFPDLSSAKKRELFIKKQKSRKFILSLLNG